MIMSTNIILKSIRYFNHLLLGSVFMPMLTHSDVATQSCLSSLDHSSLTLFPLLTSTLSSLECSVSTFTFLIQILYIVQTLLLTLQRSLLSLVLNG